MFEDIKEDEYDCNRPHKSASSCSLCKRSHWPGNKMLPKSWSKWRDDKRSLCQMILKKVALPVGVDGKSYWDAMILGITNDKFWSLRANFKQELLEQFQSKFYSISSSLGGAKNYRYQRYFVPYKISIISFHSRTTMFLWHQ